VYSLATGTPTLVDTYPSTVFTQGRRQLAPDPTRGTYWYATGQGNLQEWDPAMGDTTRVISAALLEGDNYGEFMSYVVDPVRDVILYGVHGLSITIPGAVRAIDLTTLQRSQVQIEASNFRGWPGFIPGKRSITLDTP